MATLYTSWSTGYKPSGSKVTKKFRGWIDYDLITNNNTTVVYNVASGAELNSPATTSYTVTQTATNYSKTTDTAHMDFSYDETWDQAIITNYTYPKGHSAYSVTFTVTCKGSTGTPSAWQSQTLTKSATVQIPAKPSYAVTYNMNGGSGSIANQTKWYNEALTLSSTKPTRSGYVFRGWATSATGGVAYTSGGTVAAGTNGVLNLYAVWHRVPSLTATVTSSDPYYTTVSDYVVDIEDVAVYDSTSVSSIKLNFGTQNDTRTTAGELSVPMNTTGTFTPTVIITDSLNTATTYTLPGVTVHGYTKPSVKFTAERTTVTGVPNDEGTYAVIDTTYTFTDAIATLSAPTIIAVEDGGATETVTATWYSTKASDGTLSGNVTWDNISSGDTIYALLSITNGFNLQKSYDITVTPIDSEDSGAAITQTLTPAFYTVDFLAGGHGIAFGQPASQDGFYCAMDANFRDKADVMRALFDFVYPVGSYYETSDSTFDPNNTWGGTWVLEESGRVHVSAGTGYTIGATGGNKDAIIPYHRHSVNAVTTTGGSVNSTTLDETSSSDFYYGSQTMDSGGIIRTTKTSNRMYSQNGTSTNAWVKLRIVATHSHTFTHPSTPAHNTNYVGTDGNLTNANMQPYIVVNRWHRTA